MEVTWANNAERGPSVSDFAVWVVRAASMSISFLSPSLLYGSRLGSRCDPLVLFRPEGEPRTSDMENAVKAFVCLDASSPRALHWPRDEHRRRHRRLRQPRNAQRLPPGLWEEEVHTSPSFPWRRWTGKSGKGGETSDDP